MGKGEIARIEQFLLFPQCFQKLCVVDAQNKYLWSKGLTDVQYFFSAILKSQGYKSVYGNDYISLLLQWKFVKVYFKLIGKQVLKIQLIGLSNSGEFNPFPNDKF